VPAADPVHKATIIPRGRALGMVMQLPEGDRYSMSYKQMTSRLAIMMGGRVAEESPQADPDRHGRCPPHHDRVP
jgi:cell division protease FtsH